MIKYFSKKKIVILLTLLCFMFTQSFTTLSATYYVKKQLSVNNQAEKIDKLQPCIKNMMSTIDALSANSREYGTNNEKKACNYLKNKFISYGFTPYIQKMRHRDGTGNIIRSQNLIVVKKNTTKTGKGIIVICAHYDCDKNSLGANDDASGCAVVLEVARLLKNASSAYELRFILLGGEEAGCIGSDDYALKLSDKDKRNMKAVIDIDSIAQKNYVKPRIFTISGKKNTATELLTYSKKNKNLKVNKMNRERSDYAIFDYYVMPALCIGQPYTGKLKINNSKDPISQIDPSLLKYVANIILNAFE